MASEVDICNLALTHIRSQPDVISINPAEGGVKAEQCALYYGKARRFVLRAFPWAFATTFRALALLDDPPLDGCLYAYAMPSDCLRAVHLFGPESTEPQPFARTVLDDGTQAIYCDAETPILKYVRDLTDPNAFDPQFLVELSFYLASMLAVPISGDENLAEWAFSKYQQFITQAAATSAHETRTKPNHTVSWMANR